MFGSCTAVVFSSLSVCTGIKVGNVSEWLSYSSLVLDVFQYLYSVFRLRSLLAVCFPSSCVHVHDVVATGTDGQAEQRRNWSPCGGAGNDQRAAVCCDNGPVNRPQQ